MRGWSTIAIFVVGCTESQGTVTLDGFLDGQERAIELAAARIASTDDPVEARLDAVDDILELPGVADAGISYDGSSIWIAYLGGANGVLMLGGDGTRGGSPLPTTVPTTTPPSAFSPDPQEPVGGTRVLIWAPFAGEFGECNEAPAIAARFEASRCPEYDVTQLIDADADRASVLTFTDYDVIVMVTHGVVMQNRTLFLTGEQIRRRDRDAYDRLRATGEPVVTALRGLDSEPVEFVPPVIPPCRLGEREAPLSHFYAVDPTTVRQLPGEFHNALLYAGHCYSGDQEDRVHTPDGTEVTDYDTLMEAFTEKGVGAYYGYLGLVGSGVARYYGDHLFEDLVDGIERSGDAYAALIGGDRNPQFRRFGSESTVLPCLVGAEVTWGTEPGWESDGQPTTLWALDAPGRDFDGSSACPGEQGELLFSRGIRADADIYPAKEVEGPPRRSDLPFDVDVPACSSLVATRNLGHFDEEIWINAANFPVDEDGERYREVQLRYTRLVNPLNGPVGRCELGEVHEDTTFDVLASPNCAVRLRFGPPDEEAP